MESLIFDNNIKIDGGEEPNPDFDLLFSQLDSFDMAAADLFDLSRVENSPSSTTSSYSPTQEGREETELSLFRFDSNIFLSDSSEPFSLVTLATSPVPPPTSVDTSIDSVNEKSSYSNSSIPRKSIIVSPISISLPERENNGMRVASEIILNFEPMNADSVTERDLLFLDMLNNKNVASELLLRDEDYGFEKSLSVLSNSPNDTCIDLPEESDDSSSEDSMHVSRLG
jgi:hypothetical protein